MTDRHIVGVDFGAEEPAIVVAVQRDGSHTVQIDGVCKNLAAELLHGIADRLAADHGPFPCTPPPQHDRPREDEPADPYGGRLDLDRKVWHDPRGDSWDLSLTWVDQSESAWTWDGSTGQFGEPVLRCEDGEVQPFGLLRAMYGPISPVLGGAA
jgi:hypothetical protein